MHTHSDQPTILSLCDPLGVWARPYHEAGYRVVLVDASLGVDVMSVNAAWLSRHVGWVQGVIASPLTGAGSLTVVRRVLDIVQLLRPPWWAVRYMHARLPASGVHPAWSYSPHEFGGWLRSRERSCDATPPRDAFKQECHVWGDHQVPARRVVSASVDLTCELPTLGFARAFFQSNP